jgi:hypothetical protein
VGATPDVAHGKLQTGVVFHRSSIVGLLLRVIPYASSFPDMLALLANRNSTFVDAEVILCAVVGGLHKCAELRRQAAGDKQTCLLREGDAVVLRIGLCPHRARVARLEHDAERRHARQAQEVLVARILVGDQRLIRRGVAFEFELAPEGVELRKSRVADAARHAHLARVARTACAVCATNHCHRRQNDARNPDSVLRHGRTSPP